ncbi:MAG: hypothetical protein CM15mV42_0950 [uncultured marine virus]|nr:MAG: hypothetical protein CM15mV42_0950 [uncultured marine virus]
MALDEDADFNGATDVVAGQVLENLIRDIKMFSSSPDKVSKSNPPSFTVSYNPTYGGPEDVSGDHAAYVISIDPNWLQNMSLMTAGGKSGKKMTPSQ